MKKIYIRPMMKPYDMAATNIMAGSVSVRSRVGISSFHTDEDDWVTEEDNSGNTTRKYNFWN